MVTIRSFNGYRPAKGLEDKLPSYPYDVVNSEEAREIAKDNKYSFLHIVKPEIDLPENIDLYDESVYEKAKNNFQEFIEKGYLVKEEEPAIYIYSQKMGDHFQTGIVCLASAKEYDEEKIKKHEHTKPEKVKDRTKHIMSLGAHAGPVFLTYKPVEEVKKIISKRQKSTPDADIIFSDGIRHIVWVIKDKIIIDRVIEIFKGIDYLYIADGHHRSESAANTYRVAKTDETEGFLSVLFPSDELKIMDYNRAVKDLNNFTKDEFIVKIREKFEILDIPDDWNGTPNTSHEFGMYLDGKWHLLRIKDDLIDKNDPVKMLDASLLQENLLDPVLGISDPRTDKRIDFIGGIRGMKELKRIVDNGSFKISFSLFPTSIDDLMKVADANMVMPPKSTWFEPKLRSGFIVNKFYK